MQVVEQLTQQLNGAMEQLESAEMKVKVYDAETKRITALFKAIPPDLMPSIIVGSHIIDSPDLDALGERGMAPPQMEPPPQPPGAGAPPMQ